MASNKKPSIYSDRGNIGTSEELDEYGVWVKSEPQVLSSESASFSSNLEDTAPTKDDFSLDESSADDFSTEDFSIGESSAFEDFDFSQDSSGDGESVSEEADDLEMPSGESLGTDFDDFSVSDDDGATFNTDLDITDPDLDMPDSGGDEPETPVSFDSDNLEDFDVPTVKSIENDTVQTEESFQTSGREGDLSTQLLSKIANELSSIRSELSQLKKEFSVVRASEPEDEKQDQEHGGFFSEEDDETIALTGDELDNILNTADFTEESGAEESPEADFAEEPEQETETHVLDDSVEEEKFDLDDLDIDIEMPASLDDVSTDDAIAEETSDAEVSFEDDFAASGLDDGDISLDSGAEVSEESVLADSFEDSDIGVDTAEESVSDDDFLDLDSGGLEMDLDIDTSEETSIEEASDEVTSEDEIALDDAFEASTDDIEEETLVDTVETMDEVDDFAMDTAEDDSLDMDFSTDGEDSEVSISDDFFADPIDAEESVSEESISDDSLSADDFPTDDLSMDDLSVDEPSADEPSVEDLQEAAKHSHEEIEKLQQEGARHVNFAPDNVSYLEEESDLVSDDSLDLSDAVIDEPDLSTEGIDDNVIEPSLDDIDAELDMDSLSDFSIEDSDTSADVSEEEAPAADEDLDVDTDDSFDQVIPEGLETEIEETPVPFDDDLSEDLGAAGFDDTALDIPSEEESFEAEEEIQASAEVEVKEEPILQKSPAPVAGIRAGGKAGKGGDFEIPSELKSELRNILSYMDQLLESLPEEKIEEFARSEYFDSYKKLFKELGLV